MCRRPARWAPARGRIGFGASDASIRCDDGRDRGAPCKPRSMPTRHQQDAASADYRLFNIGETRGCGSHRRLRQRRTRKLVMQIAAVRLTVSTKLGHPGSLLPARGPPARRADASSVSPDQATGRGKGQSAAQGPDSTAGGATTLSCFGRPRTIAVQSWAPVAARFLRPSASARCRQLTANDPQAQRQTDRRSHCDGDQGQGGTAEDRADRHEK